MQLHHTSFRILSGTLNEAIEILEWCGLNSVVTLNPTSVIMWKERHRIQLIEIDAKKSKVERIELCHVAFVCSDPKSQVIALQDEMKAGYQSEIKCWSEKEWWISFPNIFYDFVIKFMADQEIKSANEPFPFSKIVSVTIEPTKHLGGRAKIIGKFDDGEERVVIKYFNDQLSFTPLEVIGLSQPECDALLDKKNKAYITREKN